MSKKIKEQIKDEKKFTLTNFEAQHISELGELLKYHTHMQDIIHRFLTYIAVTRLGYTKIKENHVFVFEVDKKDESGKTLFIREIPLPTVKPTELPAADQGQDQQK